MPKESAKWDSLVSDLNLETLLLNIISKDTIKKDNPEDKKHNNKFKILRFRKSRLRLYKYLI